MRPQTVHRLRHNKSERSPRRVVILDTETRWAELDDGDLHTLRVWVAHLLVRDGDPRTTVEDAWAEGADRRELLDTITAWTRTAATTWIVAHNLTIELCTTRIVTELLADGWTLGAHALAHDSPWVRMSRGRHRITLVDSATWLPRKVEELGFLLRISKPPLPGNDDGLATWLERCRADVTILSAAVEQTMDWWDRQHLGCWSLTGTATAWNCYLHHPEPLRAIIDPDPDARAWERRAIYAGRRECWRTGQLRRSRYLLLDLERAHLTAARDVPLPRRRGKRFGPLHLDDARLHSEGWAPMAEVSLATATPRYPLRLEHRIWHPAGNFRTQLAGPEFREAQRREELRHVHGGRLYQLGPIMQRWAAWLTELLEGRLEDAPPMAHVFAKMASHRVFGRWAMRTTREEEPMPSWKSTWSLDHGIFHPGEARCSILHLNGTAHVLVNDQEGDDSFPAVLAWIQSAVRVAFGRLADTIPPARRVSGNTDGVIVETWTDPDLAAMARACDPFTPRIKAEYRDLDVVGAAHMVADGLPHLSGVPRRASATGETSLAWTTWPRMRRQLAMSLEDGYMREHREVDLGDVHVTAWVLNDGTTRPPVMEIDPRGRNRMLPFDSATYDPNGVGLAPSQHPLLMEVMRRGGVSFEHDGTIAED